MALTITQSLNAPDETYFTPHSWETKTLKKAVQREVSRAETETVITIYAKIDRQGATDLQQVVKWTHSDLYSYAQLPQVELANFFGTLLDLCNALYDHDPLDFEVRTVSFWSEARKLTQFFGMSDSYDELLTTFQILAVGYNSILDSPKVAALNTVLGRVRDVINLNDEVLDELLDTLAAAGFDLQSPMSFAAEPA